MRASFIYLFFKKGFIGRILRHLHTSKKKETTTTITTSGDGSERPTARHFHSFFIEQRISCVCARTAGVPEGAMDQLGGNQRPERSHFQQITGILHFISRRHQFCLLSAVVAVLVFLKRQTSIFFFTSWIFFNRKALESVKSKLKTDSCATRSVETFSVFWILWTLNVHVV